MSAATDRNKSRVRTAVKKGDSIARSKVTNRAVGKRLGKAISTAMRKNHRAS